MLPIAFKFDIDFVQDERVGAKVTELDRSLHLDGILQRAHRPDLVNIDMYIEKRLQLPALTRGVDSAEGFRPGDIREGGSLSFRNGIRVRLEL